MPANMQEVETWAEDVCDPALGRSDITFDYAMASAKDLRSALIYGPLYRRGAWDNFADAVRAFRRADYAAAQMWLERAYAHAGLS
jgi:hypothetical protein